MDIEVRLLRSFISIYELGSLSRAAEKSACTQAAMSMRLKMLETEVGEPLFRRRHHRLEPTFSGTEFYARALGVLATYDEFISATRNNAAREKIRLGVPDDYALGLLPRILASRSSELQHMEIEIVCDLSANLTAALKREELDLALVTLASRPASAIAEAEVGLAWVTAPGIPLEKNRPIGIAAYPEGCVFRRAMINALDYIGQPWHVAVQCRNHAGIIAAVRAGLATTAMAHGTAPAGLVEFNCHDVLPALGNVPLYLLATGVPRSKRFRLVESAIESELRAMADKSPVPAPL